MFLLGQGAGFFDAYDITDAAFVIFVMSFELYSADKRLFVEFMLFFIFYSNDYSLIHFVADYFAYADFAFISFHLSCDLLLDFPILCDLRLCFQFCFALYRFDASDSFLYFTDAHGIF